MLCTIASEECWFYSTTTILLWVSYRETKPKQPLNELQTLNPILEHKYCFSLADFNVNLLVCLLNSFTQDFLDVMFSFSYILLIARPKRIADNSATH